MARAGTKAKTESTPETVELVSPNGERKRTVNVGSNEEVSLRFDGYLPSEQASLEAPAAPAVGDSVEKTVGTNA